MPTVENTLQPTEINNVESPNCYNSNEKLPALAKKKGQV